MTLAFDRKILFDIWRSALNFEDWNLCQKQFVFLLDTLEEPFRLSLQKIHDDKLLEKILDVGRNWEEYRKDKRLSKGVAAQQFTEDRERSYQLELYSSCFDECRKAHLLPEEPVEDKKKKEHQ